MVVLGWELEFVGISATSSAATDPNQPSGGLVKGKFGQLLNRRSGLVPVESSLLVFTGHQNLLWPAVFSAGSSPAATVLRGSRFSWNTAKP